LDAKYLVLGENEEKDRILREQLALQFVQRRRQDIVVWKDDSIFPKRMTKELSYQLTDDWKSFFEGVRIYCYKLAESREKQLNHTNKMIWYAILTLFRCVASSPASAISVLSTRLSNITDDEIVVSDSDLMDEEAVDFTVDDTTPSEIFAENQELKKLLAQAKILIEKKDPKLDCLEKHLKTSVLKDGFRPVIFCRYISTAKYVGERLKVVFPKYNVEVITGELTAEERQEHIALLGKEINPILVATDCLSEGINLQDSFNAVIHYDLAWNPTRHEQREGRVDRFGQASPEVRCTMMYCEDNPVDGFILKVILRKAITIKEELGIMVPIPENNEAIEHALVQATLLRQSFYGNTGQLSFDFGEIQQATDEFEKPWKDALENAKKNKTVFAQRSLHPEDVIPEWTEQQSVLGSSQTVESFMKDILGRLNNPLVENAKGEYTLKPEFLPADLKTRFKEAFYEKPIQIAFKYPPQVGSEFIQRSHPLVELLADYVLENTLDYKNSSPIAGRCSVIETEGVAQVHALFLVRLRHQITTQLNQKTRYLMAEELIVISAKGMVSPQWIDEQEALKLFSCEASGDLSENVKQQTVKKALAFYQSEKEAIDSLCKEHAKRLLDDNRRVRSAASAKGAVSVSPCFPADLMGVYVLLPSIDLL
jgi:hypothetical protein